MVNEELVELIVTKIQQGEKRAKIKQDLLVEGWPEGDIDLAYSHIHREALMQIPLVNTFMKKMHEIEAKTLNMPPKVHVALLGVCAVALVIFAYGMYVMFDPLNASASAHDEKREADFRLLNVALDGYYDQHASYPKSLSELLPSLISAMPLDPQTREPYPYKLLPNGNYQLCANFELKPVACVVSDVPEMEASPSIFVAPTIEIQPTISSSSSVRLSPTSVSSNAAMPR